jgi:hypothetical protein
MRNQVLVALAIASASQASAQSGFTPTLPPPPPGSFGSSSSPSSGEATSRCADLAIVSAEIVRIPPNGPPLAPNEVGVAWEVSNLGPEIYRAPDENKQWLTLEAWDPATSRFVQIAQNVLPPSGNGAVTLARSASWRGYLRGVMPSGIRSGLMLRLHYAPESGSWRGVAVDCSPTNNSRTPRLPLPPLTHR